MARAKDPVTGLTGQQEAFAQAVAAGATLSDAYRKAYNVSPDTPGTTTWDDASELARHPLVNPRIAELKAAAEARLAIDQDWDRKRLLIAAEEHRQLALTGGYKGVPAANGALEIIGRATGLLSDRPKGEAPVVITRVTVVLNRGRGVEGEERVIEGESRVLGDEASNDEKAASDPSPESME